MTGLDPVAEVTGALAAEAVSSARRLGIDDAVRERLATRLPLLAGSPLVVAPLPDTRADEDGDHVDAEDPGALGRRHESLLAADRRHQHGVHYTPPAVAAMLVALALEDRRVLAATSDPVPICDPSCGGGAFLLAAADHLVAGGIDPMAAVAGLHGIDRDPLAVEVTRTALVLWAKAAGVTGDDLVAVADGVTARVVVGDALRTTWPAEGRLRAVVGNPPFGGQLARSTARDPDSVAVARALLGGSAAGYADTAGLFLLRAVEAVAPGARVVLVQPLSFLGTRDAGAVRRRLDERAVLESVWLADERVFGAAVDVCAPVLTAAGPLAVPGERGPVGVHSGPAGEVVAEVAQARLDAAGTWAPLLAAATGVPEVDMVGREVVGSWARATAGFRDEFYALVPFVTDLPHSADPDTLPQLPAGHARLVTAGLVEPARTVWGRRPTRLAGRRLLAPAVDVAALRASSDGPDGDRRLSAWADARLRPKVVVATQTRVVEAAVDDDGSWWPSVPVISVALTAVRDDDEHRWLLAAALSAPPVSAWVAERTGGTALAAHALKLSARQVAEIPFPVDRDAWAEGARLLRRVALAPGDDERIRRLVEAGGVLTEAHGLVGPGGTEVLRWWAQRAGYEGEI